MKKLLIIFMAFLFYFSGCGKSPTSPNIPIQPIKKPPVIVSFTTSLNEIWYSLSFTLSWEVTGADTIEIDQGVGEVSAKDSKEITPDLELAGKWTKKIAYTLTAKNSDGTVTANCEVTIKATARIIMWGEPEVRRDSNGIFLGYRGKVKNIGNERVYTFETEVFIILYDSNGKKLSRDESGMIFGMKSGEIKNWNLSYVFIEQNWRKRVDTSKTEFEIRYPGWQRFE